MNEYVINFLWDNEALVWVATSDDVPGLILESGSLDALIERVRFALPELLELNGNKNRDITITINTQRHERIFYHGGI